MAAALPGAGAPELPDGAASGDENDAGIMCDFSRDAWPCFSVLCCLPRLLDGCRWRVQERRERRRGPPRCRGRARRGS